VLRVYNTRTGELRGPAVIGGASISPDWGRIAALSPDGVVQVSDARTGAVVLQLRGPARFDYPKFSPDGTRIAVSARDGVVRVYDAQTGSVVLQLKGTKGMATPVFWFSPDGTRMVVRGSDQMVRVYDARTGAETHAFQRPTGILSPPVVFSPDGTRFAASASDGVVRVHDVNKGAEGLQLKGPKGRYDPVFSPDGTRIAVVPSVFSTAAPLRVHDARTGAVVLQLKAPAPRSALVFSPDWARIAIVGHDGVVQLYDARTGAVVLQFKGPVQLSTPVFSTDGTRIAAAGGDGAIRVYDAPHDITAWQAQRCEALVATLPAWHRARAVACDRAGQWFAAAFHWRRLTQAEPDRGQDHFRLGFALLNLGRTAEAKRAFASALVLKKDLAELDQADAHAILGQWDEAARLFKKAVAAPKAPLRVWQRYSMVHLQQGDRDGYCKACMSLFERFGKVTAWGNYIAWTCAIGPDALPDLKPAVELARFAVRASPADANVRNTLGAILYRTGQHMDALAELNAAIKLNSRGGTPLDFLFLAMVHHRLGHPKEARESLDQARQALEKSPPLFWEQVELRLLHREAEALLR
jgi:WD40 repeat protein/Flp pilus assembly protein TadD